MRDVRRQLPAYARLAGFLHFLTGWHIADFDDPAVDQFEWLRRQRVRIGTMDLKIAAIALARNALLVSANLSDYRQVPNLRVENWLI
jgi:tRNA(fMet)-specific endonuclease VapC